MKKKLKPNKLFEDLKEDLLSAIEFEQGKIKLMNGLGIGRRRFRYKEESSTASKKRS